MEDFGHFTNEKGDPAPDIDRIMASCKLAREEMEKAIGDTFNGIPCIVDNKLIGLGYTIHVSPELHALLESKRLTPPPNTAFNRTKGD